jgi:NADH dehydrogenase
MMIFVSGGTGFIGSHAARKLVASGHKLRLLTVRDAGLAAGLPSDQVEYIKGGIPDPYSLKGKMEGCDVAVNFVGIIVQVREATFERIHVQGIQNLLEEANRAGVKRFVHISALGTSDKPVSEYFRTKWRAEQLIKTSGIPYVILRPSIVFGPEDKFFNMLRPMVYSPIVPVMGKRKTMLQPIWVEDIASCIVKSVEEDKLLNGVWEMAGPERLTFDEILDQMADAMGLAPRLKLHIPVPLMMPVARLMEAILPKPPLTTDQLKMLSIDNTTDSNAVTDVFGVRPRSFREYWRK